jgi:hypothetical protein
MAVVMVVVMAILAQTASFERFYHRRGVNSPHLCNWLLRSTDDRNARSGLPSGCAGALGFAITPISTHST